MAPAQENASEVEKPMVIALRERARRIVRQDMASAGFGPEMLGRLLSVSRSKLYRIFEGSGGVARFIQQERLAAAHRRLTDSLGKIPISALAAEVGFGDHSAFSRAFKLEYGYSPSEVRETALAGAVSEETNWLESPRDIGMPHVELL
jgi:AraC-like DNA-binding protein